MEMFQNLLLRAVYEMAIGKRNSCQSPEVKGNCVNRRKLREIGTL